MKDTTKLTPAGKRRLKAKEELKQLGLPENIKAEIDLVNGLCYINLTNLERYSHTIPDLGPNKTGINVDVSVNGSILGLEDITMKMLEMVTSWRKALLKAKKIKSRNK